MSIEIRVLEELVLRLYEKGAHTIAIKYENVELTAQFPPRLPPAAQRTTDLTGFPVKNNDVTDAELDEDLAYAASL